MREGHDFFHAAEVESRKPLTGEELRQLLQLERKGDRRTQSEEDLYNDLKAREAVSDDAETETEIDLQEFFEDLVEYQDHAGKGQNIDALPMNPEAKARLRAFREKYAGIKIAYLARKANSSRPMIVRMPDGRVAFRDVEADWDLDKMSYEWLSPEGAREKLRESIQEEDRHLQEVTARKTAAEALLAAI